MFGKYNPFNNLLVEIIKAFSNKKLKGEEVVEIIKRLCFVCNEPVILSCGQPKVVVG